MEKGKALVIKLLVRFSKEWEKVRVTYKGETRRPNCEKDRGNKLRVKDARGSKYVRKVIENNTKEQGTD